MASSPGMLPLPVAVLLVFAPAQARPTLVRAAPLRGGDVQSPRRLFNAGLENEQQGNLTRAVQFYLSARLSIRHSFADELYARGAGYRLVRILAGYDDDAAAAAAMLVSAEDASLSSDLAPLIRTLLRRLMEDLESKKGIISSIRYRGRDHQTVIEMEEGEERHLILAEGSVGPFSAGDQVRVLIRRDRKVAFAGWRLVAIGAAETDGWQMLAVNGLPGEPGDAYGALHQR